MLVDRDVRLKRSVEQYTSMLSKKLAASVFHPHLLVMVLELFFIVLRGYSTIKTTSPELCSLGIALPLRYVTTDTNIMQQ